MNRLFSIALGIAFASAVNAQTINYSLENTNGNGKVETFTVQELDNSTEATFQMWINPKAWTDAKLIKQDNFSIELAQPNKILIKSGDKTAEATVSDLTNKWSQITITVNQGNVKLYLNNEEVSVNGTLDNSYPATEIARNDKGCILAEGLQGQIDEIRIWSKALSPEDFFWRNTLNKFNPNYDALIAYWKCDQNQCPNLVDYKFAHHGEIKDMTRVEVTDNEQFKYRVGTGYTNLMRFIDRPKITKDMFLMTNDLILLSGKVQKDGSIFPEYPDNSVQPTNVEYLESFEGRQGVVKFNGQGSKMEAEDGRVFFTPEERFGFGETQKGTFQSWIYIDKWNEGAEILSSYKDENNYITIKLGKEADKELIADFCGTVASLKNKLETNKWQYIGVYFTPDNRALSDRYSNPISIGVGSMENGEIEAEVYNRRSSDFPVELTGKDVDVSYLPLFENSTLTIGNGFEGKLDEMQIWGSNRSGAIKSDATEPYKWNVGIWDNIFLNAYWKFDEADNMGKDYQSYTGIIDFIKGYHANHRGYKIRIGLIYPDGTNWIYNVLNKEEYVNNLIRDAKELLTKCDGLDVDLEWMYSAGDWSIYNNVVRRLINEVMTGYEDKTFSCSLHAVSYNGFDKSLMNDVDYFTFQLYGPNKETYYWDYYENAYNSFVNWGYPKDKILLSYGVLLVNNGEEGYKDLFEKYGMNDDNYDPNLNQWDCNGTTKYFNGVNQVKRKQNFIIDNGCRGTMYFDMGNDQSVDDYKSLIRAQNDIIASNVDTLITEVIMAPSGIEQTTEYINKKELFTIQQDKDCNSFGIILNDASANANLEIYSIDGKKVRQTMLQSEKTTVHVPELSKGIYLIRVSQGNKTHTTKLILNK